VRFQLKTFRFSLLFVLTCFIPSAFVTAAEPVVVYGKKIVTATGKTILDGIVICVDGKIQAVGQTGEFKVPANAKVIRGEVVLPGLVDVRTCVGLSGILNFEHDSDQLESSSPLQPELRAIDAYNPREELVAYIRNYGVTTVHTGHAPGELISGQTMIVKTVGDTVESALMVDGRAIAVTLAEASTKSGKASPGTRGKQMAMVRSLLIEAREYSAKVVKKAAAKEPATGEPDKEGKEKSKADEPMARNLKLEVLSEVLSGKKALLITADRAQDIASAIRLAEEFKIPLWLDSASDAHLMIPQLKAAGVTVLLHPSMARASGEKENLSFQTASKLREAGIPFAIQGGFEPYVPKVRVVLFEAAIAAAHGLSFEDAVESITLSPAKILGIQDRVGSIAVGKDADLAIYDGDPFEYTTHCTGVVIDGVVVSSESQ
jgi:imidazolonepropionase-like amidohydrolase